MSVHGPKVPSRRYISGAAKPGVYIGRMKLPSLLSTSRAAPKSSITALLSLVMKILAGLMSRCRIFCWCTIGKPRRVALQVVHHHVDGFVLAEEVQHRDHARVADLRERTAFFEEALQAQAIERL